MTPWRTPKLTSSWRKASPTRKEGDCEIADRQNERSTPLGNEVNTLFESSRPLLRSLGMLPLELHSAGREK
jgi:hypothetical protein